MSDFVSDQDFWQQLAIDAKGLGTAKSANLIGLPDSAKAYVCSAIRSPQTCVLLVADELKARLFYDNLTALNPDARIEVLRPRAYTFTDAVASSREANIYRANTLCQWMQDELDYLIIPAQNLTEIVPDLKNLASRALTFALGDLCEPVELCEHLRTLGYERVRQIEGIGQFASRGDVIDIGLVQDGEAVAIRLSFFDNEVDDIRQFAFDTQRSIDSREQVFIPPAQEWLVSQLELEQLALRVVSEGVAAHKIALRQGAEKKQADAYQTLANKDAERFRTLGLFPGFERWLFALRQDTSSILSYIKDKQVLFLDELSLIRQRLDQQQAERTERLSNALLRQTVLPQAEDNFLSVTTVWQQLAKHPAVTLAQIAETGNGLPLAEKHQLLVHTSDRYRARETQLYRDIERYQGQGFKVVLFAGNQQRAKRLAENLATQNITCEISPYRLRQGFVWPKAQLLFIGSEDIFGVQQRARRARQFKGRKIELFSDLRPGEYVVHEVHGIGLYKGLHTITNEGVKRDYLHIAYADEDNLYIPVDSLDQIQKYIAPEGKKPKVGRMGGKQWQQAKQRASESIRKLAVNLIKIYAERRAQKGYQFSPDNNWQEEFEASFPFELTPDQARSIAEIKSDMESPKVMDRLLCGDVGFGKTEIAFRALFKAVMSGKQAAMLAPTTVLSHQHYENFCERLGEFPVRCRLLNRFVSATEAKQICRQLEQGDIDLVIGTHRLLTNQVKFRDLGLLVVDEEQRFGVNHKEKIKEKYPQVDVLTLSATPIPRTLHMSLSGIRDISTLEMGPEDRRPIQTFVLPYEEGIVDEAILREISRGGQVFYLFNNTYKIAGKCKELAERLPGARILYAHGKMSSHELDDVIASFIAGEADILVCTTIIESGIDMPNVNTIIVEQADRLGLAQLYQIRGRVGRSERQAYAYITYDGNKILKEDASKRLVAIRDFTELGSGFKIAMRDLEVRGAGNLLGAEQSGHLEAIGYDLYCKMLDEAVHELEGDPLPEPLPETVVDLNVEAILPDSYIPDEGERMDFYRKISNVRSKVAYSDVMDELLDRYGDLPKASLTLLNLAYVRNVAQTLHILRIREQNDRLILQFSDKAQLNMQRLAPIFDDATFTGRVVFNAGAKPYLTVLKAPQVAEEKVKLLVRLCQLTELT